MAQSKLKVYGVSANLIGSYNNAEARSGWSYRNFVGMGNIHADGTTVLTRSESGTTTKHQNPFLKLATTEDKTNHPTWCLRNTGALKEKSSAEDTNKTGNFYIFDFAWYLSSHGIATPDIVTIALGTNDILNYPSNESVTDCKLALEIMIKQIKKALPNAKIGVVSSTAWYNYWYMDIFGKTKCQTGLNNVLLILKVIRLRTTIFTLFLFGHT